MKKLRLSLLASMFALVAVIGSAGAAVAAPGATSSSPPSVRIVEPWGLDQVAFDVTVRVEATSAVGVTRVDVFVNNTRVGTDTTAPYAVVWDSTTSPNGFAWITATATDSLGRVGTTEFATGVIVDNP